MSLEIDFTPIIKKYSAIATPSSVDSLLRNIAINMLRETSGRIHEQGKNASGNQIGTYAPSYVKQRIKRNLRSPNKVILFYEGQMQRDYKVIPVQGGYGLGFDNSFNADKATWMQEKYGAIYDLTSEERKDMILIIRDWFEKKT